MEEENPGCSQFEFQLPFGCLHHGHVSVSTATNWNEDSVQTQPWHVEMVPARAQPTPPPTGVCLSMMAVQEHTEINQLKSYWTCFKHQTMYIYRIWFIANYNKPANKTKTWWKEHYGVWLHYFGSSWSKHGILQTFGITQNQVMKGVMRIWPFGLTNGWLIWSNCWSPSDSGVNKCR